MASKSPRSITFQPKLVMKCLVDFRGLFKTFNFFFKEGDGQADVSNYFENYTEKVAGSAEILTNSFRGFPLKGCEFQLPEGKIGAIFREKQSLTSENSDRPLKFAGTFKNFTYWNYDINPSDNDALRKTISALSVMEAVHQKVLD